MKKPSQSRGGWIAGLALFTILTIWLVETPPGLLGKADAVGYAICHRIDQRSFFMEERQLPLCARCTGMYLGILTGLVFHAIHGHRGGMPGWKMDVIFGLFAAAFAVDGINSYVHLFPKPMGIYEPSNLLRLVTGTGMGLAISAFLAPVWVQSVWPTWNPRPALENWEQMGLLVGLGLVVDGFVLTNNPLILYPLGLLSTVGVLTTLTGIYSILWLMITRRENQITRFAQLVPFLLAGLAVAMLQISLMDLGRFWLTKTWAGFHF